MVKIKSASPTLTRSWIINSPGPNESLRVSPTSYVDLERLAVTRVAERSAALTHVQT